MFRVTNKAKDVRKFRDNKLGQDILVNPGATVLTNSPPVENEIWKVEISEQPEKKNKKTKGEDAE